MNNQVRVFLSSTFRDFERERELVHVRVAPTLEAMCRHYGLSWQLSDLRWGVTSKDIDHDRIASLCLDEVDACRRASPEFNFLLLLGDIAGTRLLPEQVDAQAFQRMLGEMERSLPGRQDAAARLATIFSVPLRGGRLGRDRLRQPSDASTASVESESTWATLLAFTCVDAAAEELRRSLALSLTHQELARSGALSAELGNEGALAILRSAGAPEPSQLTMRHEVQRVLGASAVEVVAGHAAALADYEESFVKACLDLAGQKVYAARGRGTRKHFYQSTVSREPPRGNSVRGRVWEQLLAWLGDPRAPSVAGVEGKAGSGKSFLLRQFRDLLDKEGRVDRVVHFEVGRSPELQAFRRLLLAVLVACGEGGGNEHDIEALESMHTDDLAARFTQRAAAGRLDDFLIIIDDLHLAVDAAVMRSFSWLWSGAGAPRVLFSCQPNQGAELRSYAPLALFALEDLAEAELEIVAAEACAAQSVDWIEPRVIAGAARQTASPGRVQALVDAARTMPTDAWERSLGEEEGAFLGGVLEHLHRTAPFPLDVDKFFLALSASSEHGVTEPEFLSLGHDLSEVRKAILEEFRASPVSQEIPALIWHRLRSHYAPILEEVGGAGLPALRVRAAYAAVVREDIGAPMLEQARCALADWLLQRLEQSTERTARVLPELLQRLGRWADLPNLALSLPFMKVSVSSGQIESLTRVIAACSESETVLSAIRAGVTEKRGESPKEVSHWLLDLAVLARSVGYYAHASDFARSSYQVREAYLGAANSLSLAAAVEATDADLERGAFVQAEELCRKVLQSAEPNASAAQRLKANLHSALIYQRRYAEAGPGLKEQLALYTANEKESPDLTSVYQGLAMVAHAQGRNEEALDYSRRALANVQKLHPTHSVVVSVALTNHGGLLLALDDPREALAIFELAVANYATSRDQNHPWVDNAAQGYFRALTKCGRLGAAIAFLSSRLERVRHFDDSIAWFVLGIRSILEHIESDGEGFQSLFSHMARLVATSQGDAWKGHPGTRAAAKAAGSLGALDEATAKGFVRCGMLLWLLIVLAAARRGLIGRDELELGVTQLEARWCSVQGGPLGFDASHDRVAEAWRIFAPAYEGRDACLELLRQLRPVPNDSPNLIEHFSKAGSNAPSLSELRRRAETHSRRESPDERGQALILVASRALADGRFDEAIAAQKEALGIARELFGTESWQYANAMTNLGATYFRASRYDQAFDNYLEGIALAIRAGRLEAIASLENLMKAGFETRRFNELGEGMMRIGSGIEPDPAAINAFLMSAVAFARGASQRDALASFHQAVKVQEALPPELAVAWAEPLLTVAPRLVAALGAEVEAPLHDWLAS